MSLEIEYERPYQKSVPESAQKFIIESSRYKNKSRYPEKLFSSISKRLVKIFVPYTG